ncbi:MAG: hypothetical protein LCH58_03665 [Bacteroidetes bacterium]|nr:hypothetical protein [Bacteroidota bacterium]
MGTLWGLWATTKWQLWFGAFWLRCAAVPAKSAGTTRQSSAAHQQGCRQQPLSPPLLVSD